MILAGNTIKAMESGLFLPLRSFKEANLISNTCINDTFSVKKELSRFIDESCEKTESVGVKPKCEIIQKCAIGQRCCLLSKFKSSGLKSSTKIEFLKLEQKSYDGEVDAIFYNSNPSVEYLLVASSFNVEFKNLKVYDASNCSIRRIFWKNFNGFYKLETINLANNQISALNEKLFDEKPLKNLDLCEFMFFFQLFPIFDALLSCS